MPMKRITTSFLITILCLFVGQAAMANKYFENLKPETERSGFVVKNLYTDARDSAVGARLVHEGTGFTLDLFDIQSVPQAMIWTQTPPTGDMGEPHTCEHLLLGKGTKGQYVASLEDMWLGRSTAYTSQIYTAYFFSSPGGNDVFYDLLKAKLDALVNPNYSDEEIRREVCNVGVSVDPDGKLHLEEKGTVYTEMVSYYEGYWYHLNTAIKSMMYGPNHPLSDISGGNPDSIRMMTPADLRKFHDEDYRPDNMGMIATIPEQMSADDFLARFDTMLGEIAGAGSNGDMSPRPLDLPAPKPTDAPGAVKIVTYPGSNKQEPGQVMCAWPPDRTVDGDGYLMLETFVHCLGGDQTSNLYDKFVNSNTRERDWGLSDVWTSVSDQAGFAVTVGLSDIDVNFVTQRNLKEIARMIQDEVKAIAAYKPGSKELANFNQRAKGYLKKKEKGLRSYLNSPPGFGNRGGGGGRWYSHIKHLEWSPGFRKSLLQKSELAHAFELLDRDDNIWTNLIAQWKLADTPLYAVGAKADPELLTKAVEDKKKRLAAFTKGLETEYGVSSEGEAVERYKEAYDRNTKTIEDLTEKISMPEFLPNPPMTYDPQLDYQIDTVAGAVPMVASTFNSMTSATVGLALRLNVIPKDKLIYVPFLPDLITDIGVIEDGTPVDFAAMSRRLENEVLSFRAGLSRNVYTGRAELMIRGAGSDLPESQRALAWMTTGLFHPYLQKENLPRIRDVVNSEISSLRNRMKRSEESWVNFPASGYRNQTNHLLLAADCFLTQYHLMHRLKWRLMDAGTDSDARTCGELFDQLAAAAPGRTKDELVQFASNFGEGDPAAFDNGPFADVARAYLMAGDHPREIFLDALSDMAALIPDSPEENAVDDWTYLANEMKDDLLFRPEKALADLSETLALLRHRGNARLFMVSNASDRAAMMPGIDRMVEQLDTGRELKTYDETGAPILWSRMRSRYPDMNIPTYVGLVNTNTRNGVFIYDSPCAGLKTTSDDSLMDYLAAKLYGGGGAHSMFMKTWSAGLAYSNGLRSSEISGDIVYYAERCPDLSLTMRFVVDELNKAPADPQLADYAVAQTFMYNRAPNSYESRGEAMANNLADGITDDLVTAFRTRILSLRDQHGFYDKLKDRMKTVYGHVLIGYGDPLDTSGGGSYFIIGPEAQFTTLENYIASVERPQTVYRIYPRDYWITY